MILNSHTLVTSFASVTAGAVMACAGRSQTPPAASGTDSAPQAMSVDSPGPPAAPSSSPGWLAVDSAGRTAVLALVVTAPSTAPSALINGLRAGSPRVVVPVGWTVRWKWRNEDPDSNHSLVVMVQREKIPLEGGRPSFSNAMTRMVTEGLGPGQTDETTFEAEEAGWYWLLCGVPGHALKGEWIELRVDPEATTASVGDVKR
jgi:hypothetical protein